MHRRTACRLAGATLIGLAGCGGGSTGPTPTDSSATSASPSTGTAGAESIAVTNVDAPASVEVRQSFDVAVTVENTADVARPYRSALSYRRDGNDWQEFGQLEQSIEPGRTRTLSATLPGIAYLGTYRFRLERSGRTWEVKTTPRKLAFGDQFATPRRLRATVLGGNFTGTYDAVNSSETLTAGEGDRWLLVTVEFRNQTDEKLQSGPLGAFSVRAGGQEYGVRLNDPGQRVTVSSKGRARIELPFVVPADLTADDVAVRWELAYRTGRTAAVWRA